MFDLPMVLETILIIFLKMQAKLTSMKIFYQQMLKGIYKYLHYSTMKT